jgi:branched-chain amino acid transport system permease protein
MAADSSDTTAGGVIARLRGDGSVRSSSFVVAVFAAVAAVPFFLATPLIPRADTIVGYAIAAMGLGFAMGQGGQFTLGQPFVMAAAAYTTGLANVRLDLSPAATFPLALAVGVIAGVGISLPGLRLAGLYLGISTFLWVAVIPDLTRLFRSQTGGEEGLVGVRGFSFASRDAVLMTYVIGLAILVVVVFLFRNVLSSAWGIRIRTLRDAPDVLAATGISVRRTKLVVYVLASIPGACAGWYLTNFNSTAAPQFFGFGLILVLLAAVELGGKTSLAGPLVGVLFLEGWSQFIGPYSEYNTLGVGAALVASLTLLPNGIWPPLAATIDRLSARARRGRAAPPSRERTAGATRGTPAVTVGLEPVLVARGITRHFGGVAALRGVSLEVMPGTIVGLVGPNGCGKTTFVNVITGFVPPDAGELTLQGEPVNLHAAPHRIAAHGITRSFQLPQLVRGVSVADNVGVGLLRSAIGNLVVSALVPPALLRAEQERHARQSRLLENSGVEELAGQPADDLPLGRKRVMEVVRARATGAALVCLDEPAAGLNADEHDYLAATIRDMRDEGIAVLLIEHNPDFVARVCDCVFVMQSGEVVASFPDMSVAGAREGVVSAMTLGRIEEPVATGVGLEP